MRNSPVGGAALVLTLSTRLAHHIHPGGMRSESLSGVHPMLSGAPLTNRPDRLGVNVAAGVSPAHEY